MILQSRFVEYGPALLEHVLLKHGFTNASKVGKTFNVAEDLDKLMEAIDEAEQIMHNAKMSPAKVLNINRYIRRIKHIIV